MKRSLRSIMFIASLATGLMFGPSPALATGSDVMVGTGTISPGVPEPLDPGPVYNTVTFSGTAVGVFGTSVGTCNIAFTGSGTDTAATASGAGTETCNGAGISRSCNIAYARVGVFGTEQGFCVGSSPGTLLRVCEWTATSIPWTSYEKHCVTIT